MTEEQLLAAIRAEPSDELAYVALADWLEEHGQPDRAELLRLDLRLRQTPWDEPSRRDAEARLQRLLAEAARPCVPALLNSGGMTFTLIPAGRFLMGAPEEEGRREVGQRPVHEVEITRPFYLGVYPVTQAQWQSVTGSNPSWFCATGRGQKRVQGMDTDNLPVESVSWRAGGVSPLFCLDLSRLPEERAAGRTYRLPREAEWEYACRAGASAPFAFGNSLSSAQANFNGDLPVGGADKGPSGAPARSAPTRPTPGGCTTCSAT